MQSKSHASKSKREITPERRSGMAQANAASSQFLAQEDQWAVLRHEVEGEDMQHSGGQPQAGWSHSNVDDNLFSPQSSFEDLTLAQHHVDIVVAGVGGAGMNAVNRMIKAKVRGVRFVAMNTDAQVLALSEAPTCICLGQHYTKGLGAGGISSVGSRAAAESVNEVREALNGADMVFIAAGMGGGTGTGAAPIVASIARKMGALTIGIVTLPFTFEGTRRRRSAEEGLAALRSEVDALITVPNDRLLAITGRDRTLSDAFKLADDVLRQGVQGIAEVINVPGLVNVDFADVRSVLRESGTALMSIGQGQGSNRAQQAAQEAIAGGFLNVAIRGAKRVLFNISGGEDMTLFEVNEVAESIGQAIDASADITFGAVVDPSLEDSIRVTLIATGMENEHLAPPARHTTDSHPLSARQIHGVTNSPPRQAPPFASMPQVPYSPQPNTYTASSPHSTQEESSALPVPPPTPPELIRSTRNQRSLDDLRGIRSLGRRHKEDNSDQRGHPSGSQQEAETDEKRQRSGVDMPPFLRKFK